MAAAPLPPTSRKTRSGFGFRAWPAFGFPRVSIVVPFLVNQFYGYFFLGGGFYIIFIV